LICKHLIIFFSISMLCGERFRIEIKENEQY